VPEPLSHPRAPSDAQVRVVATEFLRLRPWIVGPFLLFAVVALALGGARTHQIVALGAAGSSALLFFFYERRVGARRLVDGSTLLRSLLVTLAGIALACALTGGADSPLVPMLFAPCGIGFAAFGRGRASVVLFAGVVLVAVALASASSRLAGLAVPDGSRRAVLAAAIVCSALLLRVGVAGLTAAHARTADRLALVGDELARASQARVQAIEALGARVAHEVKNPLAAIRALVEVMLESAEARAHKRLSVVRTEVDRIEKIIAGYGAPGHPLDTVSPAPTDVKELVEALVAVLEARSSRSEVALTVAADAPPTQFSLDRDRVKEALLNLTLNAIDATAPGGRVTLSYVHDDGGLALRVEDTGAGMDAETLSRVGTPYFTRRDGGTGLGVAHARAVAERHGGRLRYESHEGRGTTATMFIPAQEKGREHDADDPHL
jgi:signal transduction histidine kinase